MTRRDRRDMELALDNPARLRAVPSPAASAAPADETTDAELLVRVAERDREAFELLYHRYVRSVMGLALRRLARSRRGPRTPCRRPSPSVWRSAASYRPERGPAAPWLYAVARNAIVDRLRARTEQPAEVPDTASPDAGPLERAESSLRRRGASTARSRSCRRRSARSSSLRTGAACRRARSRSTCTSRSAR